MEFYYYIKIEGKWKRVSFEEYVSFDGEAMRLPSTWKYMYLDAWLRKER